MKVKYITFTGADDSNMPKDLLDISRMYPFVEWGILLSATQEGGLRFPSKQWMSALADLAGDSDINLSGHLCGKWLRDLLLGKFTMPHREIWKAFKRIQLNFHADKLNVDIFDFHQALFVMPEKDFIFQVDGRNEGVYRRAVSEGVRAFPFFDLSHGAGVLPGGWDVPLDNKFCGYAGGLGPDNLEGQLKIIDKAVGDREIWVDMETQVRSNGGMEFDLDKVMKCIEIVKPYVG